MQSRKFWLAVALFVAEVFDKIVEKALLIFGFISGDVLVKLADISGDVLKVLIIAYISGNVIQKFTSENGPLNKIIKKIVK